MISGCCWCGPVDSGEVDSGLDSKVDSGWLLWTPKIQGESTHNERLSLCFIEAYRGCRWFLDSKVDSQNFCPVARDIPRLAPPYTVMVRRDPHKSVG